MVLSNVIMLSQIAGHVVVLTLSLCIIVPMVCHDRDFHGRCLLFATGNWNEDNGLFDVKWSSTFYCNFATITGFFLFFISSIEIYRISRLTLKQLEASFLGLFLDVLFGITSSLMTFAAAIMITLGFISWCNDMTQRFPSCEIAAGQNITQVKENINTTGFYFEMGIAQFGAWSSFAACVALTVFALFKLVSEHQMRNMKASMYLERQRLVNDDAFRSDGIGEPPYATDIESPDST